MEIELKYTISDSKVADRIWEDLDLKDLEEDDSRNSDTFNGTYYDTDDYTLFKNDIAFRMREEGKKLVASLKWNGQNQGPLHKREELNINLGEDRAPEHPDPSVFRESEEGRDMMELIGDKVLSSMIQVNVLRRSFRVDTGNSLVEISLDDGEVITKSGKVAICELEIELFSGDQEDLVKLGEQLQIKYDLMPEKDSKFARGLKLLGKI